VGHFRPTLRVSARVRCLLFPESDLLTAQQRNDAKGQHSSGLMHCSKQALFGHRIGAGWAWAYSGNPAFQSPSINSFDFDCPPRAIHEVIVKAGSTSSRRAAYNRHRFGVRWRNLRKNEKRGVEGGSPFPFLVCYLSRLLSVLRTVLVGVRTVCPRIRCAERVSSVPVGYDADIIVSVTVSGLVLVTVGGMVSSGRVHPLSLQPMLC
jgi:hypothetical protein